MERHHFRKRPGWVLSVACCTFISCGQERKVPVVHTRLADLQFEDTPDEHAIAANHIGQTILIGKRDGKTDTFGYIRYNEAGRVTDASCSYGFWDQNSEENRLDTNGLVCHQVTVKEGCMCNAFRYRYRFDEAGRKLTKIIYLIGYRETDTIPTDSVVYTFNDCLQVKEIQRHTDRESGRTLLYYNKSGLLQRSVSCPSVYLWKEELPAWLISYSAYYYEAGKKSKVITTYPGDGYSYPWNRSTTYYDSKGLKLKTVTAFTPPAGMAYRARNKPFTQFYIHVPRQTIHH